MTPEQLKADGWTAIEDGVPDGSLAARIFLLLYVDVNKVPHFLLALGMWFPRTPRLPEQFELGDGIDVRDRVLRFWKLLPDYNAEEP